MTSLRDIQEEFIRNDFEYDEVFRRVDCSLQVFDRTGQTVYNGYAPTRREVWENAYEDVFHPEPMAQFYYLAVDTVKGSVNVQKHWAKDTLSNTKEALAKPDMFGVNESIRRYIIVLDKNKVPTLVAV